MCRTYILCRCLFYRATLRVAFVKLEILTFIFALFRTNFTATKARKYFANIVVIFSQKTGIANADMEFSQAANIIIQGTHALG